MKARFTSESSHPQSTGLSLLGSKMVASAMIVAMPPTAQSSSVISSASLLLASVKRVDALLVL